MKVVKENLKSPTRTPSRKRFSFRPLVTSYNQDANTRVRAVRDHPSEEIASKGEKKKTATIFFFFFNCYTRVVIKRMHENKIKFIKTTKAQ